MPRKYLEADLREVFVVPLYMKIMGGRIIPPRDYERSEKLAAMARVVASVNPQVVDQLLAGGWREVITASFIGLLKLEPYQDEIGRRLVASPVCYAGQAHCFTMLRLANPQSVHYLKAYLEEHWLAKPECYYDQEWAMATLCLVDEKLRTNAAEQFLVSGGRWEQFCQAQHCGPDIDKRKTTLYHMVDLADEIREVARNYRPIEFRYEPSPDEIQWMKLQSNLIRVMYKSGVAGNSPWFPWLLKLARAGPLGSYHLSHRDWIKQKSKG